MTERPAWLEQLERDDPERAARFKHIGECLTESEAAIARADSAVRGRHRKPKSKPPSGLPPKARFALLFRRRSLDPPSWKKPDRV